MDRVLRAMDVEPVEADELRASSRRALEKVDTGAGDTERTPERDQARDLDAAIHEHVQRDDRPERVSDEDRPRARQERASERLADALAQGRVSLIPDDIHRHIKRIREAPAGCEVAKIRPDNLSPARARAEAMLSSLSLDLDAQRRAKACRVATLRHAMDANDFSQAGHSVTDL